MTNDLVIKMTLDAWHARVKEADAVFEALSDEQLQNEVAPGKNRAIYLLGHLAAVHDRMMPLLGFGEQAYPQLNEFFIQVPDKSKPDTIPAKDLRAYWKNVNTTLADHFSKLQPEQWLEKHTAVTAEAFAKEPHRNKLNIIISRTSHISYHAGQLALLKR